VQFEWGAQLFRYDKEQPPGPGGHNWTTFGGGVEALDHLGYTCYFTGDRGEKGRLLVQITGCMVHPPFCQVRSFVLGRVYAVARPNFSHAEGHASLAHGQHDEGQHASLKDTYRPGRTP